MKGLKSIFQHGAGGNLNRRSFIKKSLVAGIAGVGWSITDELAIPMELRPRLKGAFRRQEQNGWTFVHLESEPREVGFQHGYLLADKIEDQFELINLMHAHGGRQNWGFFREKARTMWWPHIESEYREEMLGISQGLAARGLRYDVWDVVALNGMTEWRYFLKQYDTQHKIKNPADSKAPSHCSAFVATGSYTKDGRVIIAHNCWSGYLDGERMTMIFDIVPAQGHRILMDGSPGLIDSGDDFGMNSAGIAITETTIESFVGGYDPQGIPEFVRARKAMQYASSIEDYARIMKQGNNGGLANGWLLADLKTNEVADFELGFKNVNLWRTADGYFVGSNFPVSPNLTREETHFNPDNPSRSANARHVRWKQLMAQYKGKIDLSLAQQFLGDHFDTYQKKVDPDERTICGHIDLSPRGYQRWEPPYGDGGTVQNKAADARMCERMALSASAGHCCGIDFKASEFLEKHPQFDWQKPLLRNMDSNPWTEFSITG
ncbi:MAG: C45 family autoproteolytic acyltransferase/hydrolase [Acidobacteriaceae bacterium]